MCLKLTSFQEAATHKVVAVSPPPIFKLTSMAAPDAAATLGTKGSYEQLFLSSTTKAGSLLVKRPPNMLPRSPAKRSL